MWGHASKYSMEYGTPAQARSTMSTEVGHVLGSPQQGTLPWQPSTKCVRVKNLPSQWTENPEKAQQALRDLLEVHAHLAVSQVVIKRTYLYQPKEGTEQHSFAHVWLYITAAHNNILEDISTLTVQGKNLKAAWYPAQHEGQTRYEGHCEHPQEVRTETRGRLGANQGTQSPEPRGSGLNRTHNRGCREWQQLLIPQDRDILPACYDRSAAQSMWSDTESFQAILPGDHQVLLTTFSMTRNEWITVDTSKDMLLGTMWSYKLHTGGRSGLPALNMRVLCAHIRRHRPFGPTNG